MKGKSAPQIFVVGCPRSGTSLFARFLDSCGLDTVDHKKANSQYPSGYFEHLPLLMFFKALERLPRGADHRITTEALVKSEYLDDDFIRLVFHAACAPILDRSVDFIKFPQFALALDFLFEQFQDIHVLALWRNPESVFRSLITKEFPKEMLPASSLKAVMLWNVYACHIVEAKNRNPDRVTVMCIDELVEKDVDISPLLRQLGFTVEGEKSISQCMTSGIWTRRVSWTWRVYYHSMRLLVLAGRRFLSPDRVYLADSLGWQKRLRAITFSV